MGTDRVAVLEGVWSILDANGIDVAEVQEFGAARAAGTTRPTVRTYAADLLSRVSTNSSRTYRTHLRRLVDGTVLLCDCLCAACLDVKTGCTCACERCERQRFAIPALGDRPVSSATFSASVVESVVTFASRHAARTARVRNSRRRAGLALLDESGKGGACGARDAISSLLARAVADGYLGSNTARSVRVSRQTSKVRSLTTAQLLDVIDAAGSGGNDPALDLLLVWFHYETGARRRGALNLRVSDLMAATGQIRLREKGDTDVAQPATAELIDALTQHALARGGERCDPSAAAYDPAAPVLHYLPRANGSVRPLTNRRYDTLFRRLQLTLAWAGSTQFTAHGLRHTAGAAVERRAGTAVARRFLRHAARTDTDTYTAASEAELYEAFEDFTGEEHPLAD